MRCECCVVGEEIKLVDKCVVEPALLENKIKKLIA
jgi:hypothetical protein